ncbi:putative NADH dehydrogenase/NAD(P)H nitroreductase, partial [Clarias magur]
LGAEFQVVQELSARPFKFSMSAPGPRSSECSPSRMQSLRFEEARRRTGIGRCYAPGIRDLDATAPGNLP